MTTKIRRLLQGSSILLQGSSMLLPMPPLAMEAAQTMEAQAGASRATRGHARRSSHTPRPEPSGEGGSANSAEAAKLALARPARAAAGERGGCAPRAAAPAPSPRRPFRRPSQESCP